MGCVGKEPHLLVAAMSGGWDGLCRKSPICWLQQGVVGMGCVERAPFAGCCRSGGWDGLCRKSPICWLLQGVGG